MGLFALEVLQQMSGYNIIEDNSMEQALSTVKACPFPDIGDSLAVLDMMQMSV
jgi:hypothetical protein